jgi:hypothetical protein
VVAAAAVAVAKAAVKELFVRTKRRQRRQLHRLLQWKGPA